MKFRTDVEPAEPMRGLEVPEEVVEALGGGKRPPVTITINGHSWKSRVAIMRGRYLLGLSKANRQAAGVSTGDEVEVEVELELDVEPRVVVEPTDFARALDAAPAARAAYDRLAPGHTREHVLAIEGAKKPGTRSRRIETAVANLRKSESAAGPAARSRIRKRNQPPASHSRPVWIREKRLTPLELSARVRGATNAVSAHPLRADQTGGWTSRIG